MTGEEVSIIEEVVDGIVIELVVGLVAEVVDWVVVDGCVVDDPKISQVSGLPL